MGSKSTLTNTQRQAAFTLVEMMVASGLALMVSTAILTFSYFSSRSLAAINDYTEMNQLSRLALDKMSKDIRQARQLTSFSSNSLTFQDSDDNPLQFTYDSSTRTLVRVSGGQTITYLTQCDALRFWIYQRTPISNSFDCYYPAFVTNARLVGVTWTCSRPILGSTGITESAQSAKIALRNH